MVTQVVNVKTDRAIIAEARRAGRYVPIHRPYKWSNRYVIGRDGTRQEVIDKFRKNLLTHLRNHPDFLDELAALKDKVLGCFCVPDT